MPRRKHTKVDPTIALAARFAQQLAALRAERGETQKQLAIRLGMTESMISRLENGEHLPSLRTLCRIAAGFDRTLEVAFHEHEHAHSATTAPPGACRCGSTFARQLLVRA
jgi:transcriptional regulator with XRE-family HTH domain